MEAEAKAKETAAAQLIKAFNEGYQLGLKEANKQLNNDN